jgi:hypothetical protein
MAKFVEPKPGEGKKAYLHRAYGIGKGAGRGRISREGHERLAEAVSKGFTFDEPVAPAKNVKPKPKREPAPAKAQLPPEAKELSHKAIRAWAKDKGITVSSRGRVHPDVILQYLAEVPPEQRGEREDESQNYGDPAPRVHPVGTKWRVDFQYKGEPYTQTVSDRTACGNCGWSLGWCGCAKPFVATGYGDVDTPVRVTAIYPGE